MRALMHTIHCNAMQCNAFMYDIIWLYMYVSDPIGMVNRLFWHELVNWLSLELTRWHTQSIALVHTHTHTYTNQFPILVLGFGCFGGQWATHCNRCLLAESRDGSGVEARCWQCSEQIHFRVHLSCRCLAVKVMKCRKCLLISTSSSLVKGPWMLNFAWLQIDL